MLNKLVNKNDSDYDYYFRGINKQNFGLVILELVAEYIRLWLFYKPANDEIAVITCHHSALYCIFELINDQ
jgi:hypothetical protein